MFHAYYPTHAPFGGCDVESFLSDSEDEEGGAEKEETAKDADGDDEAERSGASSATERDEDEGEKDEIKTSAKVSSCVFIFVRINFPQLVSGSHEAEE